MDQFINQVFRSVFVNKEDAMHVLDEHFNYKGKGYNYILSHSTDYKPEELLQILVLYDLMMNYKNIGSLLHSEYIHKNRVRDAYGYISSLVSPSAFCATQLNVAPLMKTYKVNSHKTYANDPINLNTSKYMCSSPPMVKKSNNNLAPKHPFDTASCSSDEIELSDDNVSVDIDEQQNNIENISKTSENILKNFMSEALLLSKDPTLEQDKIVSKVGDIVGKYMKDIYSLYTLTPGPTDSKNDVKKEECCQNTIIL